VNSPLVSAEDLRKFQTECQQLPSIASVQNLMKSERYSCLDLLQRLAYEQRVLDESNGEFLSAIDLPEGKVGDQIRLLIRNWSDWDAILIQTNHIYDQVAVALTHENYRQRLQQLEAIEISIDDCFETLLTMVENGIVQKVAPEKLSELMTCALLKSFSPAIDKGFVRTEANRTSRQFLTQIGLAVAVYQRTEGVFPDSLEILVPKYLKTLPKDPFSGDNFRYRLEDQEALIYSIGPNLQYDNAVTREVNPDQFDIVFPVEAQNRSQ